jgi:hypothetical protein
MTNANGLESITNWSALIAGCLILLASMVYIFAKEAKLSVVGLALIGLALVLAPRLKALGVDASGTKIEFFERAVEATSTITETLERLTDDLTQLNQQHQQLALKVQQLAAQQGNPAAPTADKIIDDSRRLSESLDRLKTNDLRKLDSIQKSLEGFRF